MIVIVLHSLPKWLNVPRWSYPSMGKEQMWLVVRSSTRTSIGTQPSTIYIIAINITQVYSAPGYALIRPIKIQIRKDFIFKETRERPLFPLSLNYKPNR